ncbi:MAG: PEP-CTERM sorting domain-containing protein [Akkermansia muciniphila]
MKHSFLLAALIFAGQVLGGDVELNLGTLEGSGLISYDSGESVTGVVIGSNAKTGGTTQSNSVVHGAGYATLSNTITNNLVWYSNIGSSTTTDISGINAVDNSATIVTDGPSSSNAKVSAAAFGYTLTSSVLATLDTSKSITLNFKVYVSGGNNNKDGQNITFNLLSSVGDSNTFTYANGTKNDGGTVIIAAEADVVLTLSSDKVQLLAATGVDQKLIFVASDSNIISGSNEAFTIKDIKLKYSTTVPEPATATLSLLALAGLCVRRRRR